MNWGRKWLVSLNAGKLYFFLFDLSNTMGENGWVQSPFTLNWIGALTLSLLLKLLPRKLVP